MQVIINIFCNIRNICMIQILTNNAMWVMLGEFKSNYTAMPVIQVFELSQGGPTQEAWLCEYMWVLKKPKSFFDTQPCLWTWYDLIVMNAKFTNIYVKAQTVVDLEIRCESKGPEGGLGMIGLKYQTSEKFSRRSKTNNERDYELFFCPFRSYTFYAHLILDFYNTNTGCVHY